MDSRPALLLKNFEKDLVEVFPDIRNTLSEPIEFAANVQLAAARHAYAALVKKWVPTSPDNAKALSSVAIAAFIACNDKCAGWTPTEHPVYSRVLETVRNKCYDHFSDKGFCWSSIFSKGRTGPGASVASRGQNSAFEKLYLNRMSTTNMALYKAYIVSLRPFPLLLAAEMQRRKRFKSGTATRIVEGSTLSCVRKNSVTDRTVCTEASLNMYAQLGLGDTFECLLREFYGYDPALQQARNRELARRGSLSGKIATIDSTSASDTIAYLLTDRVFHPILNAAIDDCRSESTKINGKYVKLHMVSSMGNGFTFPMMTYLFSVVIESLCEVLGEKFVRFDSPGSPFGVFGDDICVPTHLYEPLCETLKALGFIPNLEKSYARGEFRESCGGDYLGGNDIRGVYIRKLDQASDFYSAINRLNVWSTRHCIPLRRTIRFLLVKGWTKHVIPCDEDDSAGVKTNYFGDQPEYVCLKPVVTFVPVSWTLYAKREKGHKGRRRIVHHALYKRFDNPMGCLLCVINGSLINGVITRRQRVTVYEECSRFTASTWSCDADFTHDVAKRDWEIQTAQNLGLMD